MPIPTSTYRLQIRQAFPLADAAAVCDYLASLGAGAAYLSPLLPSTEGSDHGYDVVRFDTVDPQRGGRDGWQALLAAVADNRLRVVVDIVPNHAGVADPTQNPAWWDVLEYGPDAEHARWFDIDWSRGRLLIPVLGDEFDPSELAVVDTPGGAELHYYEHHYPVAPGTEPAAGETAADVHDRQHYELVSFRRADTEQNYRRFFAVADLAGLRVEDQAVFDATHAEIARWVREDGIDGLRVDHPDGLADPLQYLQRLRDLLGDDRWLVIEKILEPGEQLPPGWPVEGTTGYDALVEAGGVFLDPSAEAAFDRLYRQHTGDELDAHQHVERGKRFVAETILQAEIRRLAQLVPSIEGAAEALTELVVAFPVYRSYLPEGAEHLALAIDAAQRTRPDLADVVTALVPRLTDPADELCSRFQQTTGAVMAKGVEDTAFYRYSRFVALNEVGGDPSQFGMSLDAFHAAQQHRQAVAPLGMTTLSTHDTKRGEDVRARLVVLGELPDEWSATVQQLMGLLPLPSDLPFAYLMWQTFVGTGFIARERMHAYAEKAMREAARSTQWTDVNESFEAAVHKLVDAAYDDAAVHEPLARLIERVTPYGWSNALGQKLVQLTMPGIPDVYQGTELWEDSLVDPDNRRAVDFDARRTLLASLDSGEPPAVGADGAAKLWVTSRALRLRRDRSELFTTYQPLRASGPAAAHAVAFDRGGAVTVATRLPVGLERAGGWGDTTLDLDGAATDVLTGRPFSGEVRLAELLATYPVALLTR